MFDLYQHMIIKPSHVLLSCLNMIAFKESDMTADRDEHEENQGSADSMDLPVNDKSVIAFPHEHHWALAQEWLAVFGGPSNITMIDLTPGSGAKLLGVLLSNSRAIAVTRSSFHTKWILDNLVGWVRQKRLVNITQLAKPDNLIQYEKTQKAVATPKSLGSSAPAPKLGSPAPAATPSPTPPKAPPVPSNPPVNPTGLLEAFGKVAQ